MTRWVCGSLLILLAATAFAQPGPVPVQPQPIPAFNQPGPPQPNRPKPTRPALGPAGPIKVDRHGDPLPAGAVARYGTVRLRHGPEPTALGFTFDGKILGSMSNTNDGIRLWDPNDGKEIARLNNPVQYASLGRDGTVLFIDEGRCKHWQPTTGTIRELPEKSLPENTQCLAVNPNVRTFAVGSPQKITLIDIDTGKHLRELKYPGDQAVTRIIYSPDGRWLAASGQTTGVFLWDIRTFKRVRTYRSEHNFPEFTFSLDGTRIAIAGDKLRVFPVDSEEVADEFKAPEGEFLHPKFSNDGKWVYVITLNGEVIQIDAATGEAKEPLAAPEGVHMPMAVSPDAKFAAAIDQSGGIKIWDPKTGKGPEAERLPTLLQPGFSDDGKTVWTLSVEGKLYSFDAATGKPAKMIDLPIAENDDPNWSPQARYATVLLGGEELELQVIDVDTKKTVGKIGIPQTAGVPLPAFCETDRNRVALFMQGSVWVCNVATGKTLRTINFAKSEDAPPSHGAISPDGRLVAVAAQAGPLVVWEVATGKKRFEFNALTAAMGANFSVNGRYLVGWDGGGTVAVFDLRFGALARRFQIEAPASEGITVEFSPDAKRIAIGGHDGQIAVWDVATGDPVATFDRHDGSVTGLAWSKDGKHIASSATDGTVLVWDVPEKTGGAVPEAAVAGFDEAFRLLGSAEPVSAQRGMDLLYRSPGETPRQCSERIPVPAAAVPGKISKLIADLDDEEFQVRSAAAKELEAIGGEASSHLRTAIEKSQSAEVRKLAGEVLTRIETSAPKADDLRATRAIEVLEGLGTPEAKAVLTKWAGGPAGHRITIEANAALARLKTPGK